MKTYSITQVQQLLSVDNKTLARWLEKEGITPQASPHDERVKRITREQLERLASIHERPIGALPVEKEVHPTVKALERKVTDQAEQIALLESVRSVLSKQGEQLASAHEEVLTRLQQMEDRMNALEAELHDIRVVYLSKLLDYDPEQFKALNTRLDALEQRAAVLPRATPPRLASHPAERRPAPPSPVAPSTAPHRIPVESLDELPHDAIPLSEFAQQHGIENTKGFRERIDKHFAHYAYRNERRPREVQRYVSTEQQQQITEELQGRG